MALDLAATVLDGSTTEVVASDHGSILKESHGSLILSTLMKLAKSFSPPRATPEAPLNGLRLPNAPVDDDRARRVNIDAVWLVAFAGALADALIQK